MAMHVEIMVILNRLKLKSYIRWEEVTKVGRQSGPHLNTHIWPAKNSAMALILEEEEADMLMEEIRELRRKMGKSGVKAFSWTIDEAT